jgi:hypothetical protein
MIKIFVNVSDTDTGFRALRAGLAKRREGAHVELLEVANPSRLLGSMLYSYFTS